MKQFKVLLDNEYLGQVPISNKVTVANLKDYSRNVIIHNKKDPKEYVTDIYLEPKNKLDLTKIQDNLVLSPYFHLFTDPYLHIYRPIPVGTNFLDLPSDMKRYLINLVEPVQALELCKTVQCNWEHLLNLNYDFITQGFAPGNSVEEKFRYLANRVSKNIQTTPEIIFIHFEGIPLGKQRFYEYNDKQDEDDMEDAINDRRMIMKTIITGLSKHPAVEWVRQDDYNAWIKVKDSSKLPTRFTEDSKERHRKTLTGFEMYDYPLVRLENVKLASTADYPGTVNITPDVIKNMILKLTDDLYINTANIDQAAEDIQLDWNNYDTIPEYNVYTMMKEGYNRSEAEVFSRATFKSGTFSQNLEKLYNFKVDKYF